MNDFIKFDGFILDFTEIYLRDPVLDTAMEAKLLYMQEEQSHFTHSTYRILWKQSYFVWDYSYVLWLLNQH